MYKDDLRLYLRLLAYLKPHKLRMTAAILAMLGVSGLTALLAYLVKPTPVEMQYLDQYYQREGKRLERRGEQLAGRR